MDKLTAATWAAVDPPIKSDGTQVLQRAGWYQLFNPHIKDPSENEVLLSLLSDQEVDQRIDETFSLYKQFALPFKWAIGPMAAPNKIIEQKIADRSAISWDFRGMSIDCEQDLGVSSGVRVELVNPANFNDFLEANLIGWNLKHMGELFRSKFEQMSAHPLYRCYVATKNGQLAGTARTLLKDGYGYLLGAVVMENFRGYGIYRSLVAKRLADLHRQGIPFAVTQAKEMTSVPILNKLGFRTEYHAKIYQFGT